MKKQLTFGIFSLFILAGILASCATSGADAFLAKNVPAEDRADLLFKQGVIQYNDALIARNDLTAIPNVRLFFVNALMIDPMNAQAQAYIDKVDGFRNASFSKNLAKAQRLQAKDKRTDSEDYELALAVARASTINPSDTALIKVKYASASARKAAVQKRVDKLSAIETKILAEKKSLTLGKLVPQATRVIAEIEGIDPGNSSASSTRKNIDSYIMGLARKDIDTAKVKLADKKYGEAEAAIIRAEKTVANINPDTANEIQTLKYQIYLRWGTTLLGMQKYGSAEEKANIAMAINRSPEALDLKSKINKASTARDYDAEINDIASDIDNSIAQGELVGAWNSIAAISTKVTKQSSKDILASKKAAVLEKVKAVYADGITAYNEEDYDEAKGKFRTVLKIDANYEQAQAYLDRTNNKIRALSGDE
jgi:tetratricopeptide (TPR) repeat protein